MRLFDLAVLGVVTLPAFAGLSAALWAMHASRSKTQ
jgi:hypothetical protein